MFGFDAGFALPVADTTKTKSPLKPSLLADQFSTKHSATLVDGRAGEAAEPARRRQPHAPQGCGGALRPRRSSSRPRGGGAPSRLVGSIVEKDFSAPAPSFSPRPTVLPFPVARHRSHGPHWGPASKDAGNDGADEEDDEMDVDETDYLPVAAAAAGPVRRKEKKGMDFSRWREIVGDAPPKRTQGKPAQVKKQITQKVNAGTMTSKVGGAAAGKRELEEGGMRLDSGDARGISSTAGLVTDVAPKKQTVQIQSRDAIKAGVVRDMALRGDHMELDAGESSIEAEINAENMARLAEMSAGEIAEAQAEILNRMDPKLVELLRRRGREKSGGKKGGDRDKGQKNSGPGKAAKATPGDWLTAGEHSGHSWKAWSDRVERIRSCRFSLEGEILGFQSYQEQQDGKKTHAESVAERDFLRTEGDPAAVGYTINEAVALTRSMVPGQRFLALQLLASILNRALRNLHKMDLTDNGKEMNDDDKFDDWQAVWAYALGPEPELVLSLR
ncbi:hypothetical protein PR202_ga15093 [Eleusine coracana subsp. coracana]|uniref:Uncharacterized protein n=1 Tax=Eleusine coracana subsp. coracana TaxID=191504 RepID=A0AAV5CJC2_ELECO|nr:hypothetical protein PR202_ga15093 [Eleusine coracana subsp. coracana]